MSDKKVFGSLSALVVGAVAGVGISATPVLAHAEDAHHHAEAGEKKCSHDKGEKKCSHEKGEKKCSHEKGEKKCSHDKGEHEGHSHDDGAQDGQEEVQD